MDSVEIPKDSELDGQSRGEFPDDPPPQSDGKAAAALLDDESPSSTSAGLFVVGVGASAGGLEALEKLFGNMPEDTGMAFVVIQHLSPDFKSVMDELLARRTKIPVLLVENGMRVEPNRIYLIPARKEMIISGGRLLLSDKGASQELTLPIDIFFRSLAQDVGDHAIGIVLSGAGSDGARGIRDIHDAGGLVLSQDEETADFDGMPRSARDTGVVDHVLPPSEMPRALVEHGKHPIAHNLSESLGGTTPRPYGVAAALRFLQNSYGIDFSHYKPSTVVRRIERRLQLTQAPSLEAYVERITTDSDEMDALFRDLLIGVTRFFRDREAFDHLERSIIPDLLERTEKKSDEVRIWIAGCATGEEAYSIGILVTEALAKRNDRRRLKILATDVHRGSLDFASRGLYSEDRVVHVRPDLLERYFDKRGPSYQVSPELRQLVVFAPHNVIKDAPFTRIDLISCRNLLIYLQPPAQKRVLSLLHFALKRQGILFLGPSENVGVLGDDFESVDAHWRIFRKERDLRIAPVSDTRIPMPQTRVLTTTGSEGNAGAAYSLSQVINVYDALLDEHMPPSLLVNERRELVHAFNGAGRFLTVRNGRPSLDVLDMVTPDLKMAMAGALQRAIKDDTAITYNGLRFMVGNEERAHRLTVKPIMTPGAPLKHLLISIDLVDSIRPPAPVVAEAELDLSQVSRDQLGSLEAELRRTKESLQSTIEELETSNEELQAANEELLASNEELQSTNEELQSVNEELYTVNAEYQKKIRELTELTNDMDNLLASIQVGTIFLDKNLCIRKFTPLIAEAFNLLPQDIGRPLGGFTNRLSQPRLLQQLEEVLATERSIEEEVSDRAGNWFFLRILPYKARGSVDGVVLTLVDVNALKAVENEVFRERYLLNSLMNCVPDIIYFKDNSGRFVRINKAMAERVGLKSAEEAAGRTAAELSLPPELPANEALDRAALRGQEQAYKEEHYDTPQGIAWFVTTRQPLRDADGRMVGMFGVARDISEQKRAEEEIRLGIRRRDEFLAMLSHELRNPLAAIVNAALLLHQAQSLSDGQTKSLEVIERQSRQMARLLDDLLEVNRITQNKIALKKSVIDTRVVVQEAAAALREKFVARRVTLAQDFDQEPVWAEADAARLQQIVVNLLDNASKYNRPTGHASVSVRAENGSAVIRVTDDGVGIDAGIRDSIFEPFVQGRTTIHRTEGGMGVGLSVVRSLVQMHGGTVTAESHGPGHGSAFTVVLPRATAEAKSSPMHHSPVPWPTGRRVVVVEDNLDGCEMMELLLQRAGYEVFTAHDGKAGLELIEEKKPDIALVDIGLPVMDGFELARRLRASADGKGLYMVALTGYGQAADHSAALEAGFNEHLVKPLDPDDLERLLQRGEAE